MNLHINGHVGNEKLPSQSKVTLKYKNGNIILKIKFVAKTKTLKTRWYVISKKLWICRSNLTFLCFKTKLWFDF